MSVDGIDDTFDVELLVKAGSDGKGLGDCIQCHRCMMLLALKGISAKVTTVDLLRKPTFYKENYAGMRLPCLVTKEGTAIDDVNEIQDYIEKTFPEPSLKCADPIASRVGVNVFQKFSAFIRNKDPNKDDSLQFALLDELKRLNDFLGSSNKTPGQFLAGDEMLQPDCILLPKLHHIKVALKYYKDFEVPEELPYLVRYMKAAEENDIFVGTRCEESEVLKDWAKHVADQKKAQHFLRTQSLSGRPKIS